MAMNFSRPNFSGLGEIGENLGKIGDRAISRAQQYLGPESQAGWALGTNVNPGDYGGLWQKLTGGGIGGFLSGLANGGGFRGSPGPRNFGPNPFNYGQSPEMQNAVARYNYFKGQR